MSCLRKYCLNAVSVTKGACLQKFIAAGDIFDAEMDSSDDGNDDGGGENNSRKPEHSDNSLTEHKGNIAVSGMEMIFNRCGVIHLLSYAMLKR